MINTALAAVAVVVVAGSIWYSMGSEQPVAGRSGVEQAAAPATPATPDPKPTTLDELLALPVDQLGKVDIARVNLLCAEGLPGAERVNSRWIDHALATLGKWAERVRFETERHLYRLNDPRFADHYGHSEARLRAEFLVQVLQQDLAVRYDMSAAGNFSFADSRVAFLHGLIPGPGQTVRHTEGGTCASMPVLYVAVGRRLGYPLKLATTDSHVFVRWDGEDHANPKWRERFNIEGTGNGFAIQPDAYYRTWPKRLTDQQVRANRFLVSLSPAEELASFLAARGHCAIDNRQTDLAAQCYRVASQFDPARPAYRAWLRDASRTKTNQTRPIRSQP